MQASTLVIRAATSDDLSGVLALYAQPDLDNGRVLPIDEAQAIFARFAAPPTGLDLSGAQVLRREGREIELVVNGNSTEVIAQLTAGSPERIDTESLSLEEIFVTTLASVGAGRISINGTKLSESRFSISPGKSAGRIAGRLPVSATILSTMFSNWRTLPGHS